jgi:hypothetical protein
MENTPVLTQLRVKMLADLVLSSSLKDEQLGICVLTCIEIIARMIEFLPQDRRDKGFQDIHDMLKEIQSNTQYMDNLANFEGTTTVH